MKNRMIVCGLLLLAILNSCASEKIEPHHTFSTVVKVAGLEQSTAVLPVGEALDLEFHLYNDTSYPVQVESADVIFYDKSSGIRSVVKKDVLQQMFVAPGEKSGKIVLDDIYKAEKVEQENHFCRLGLRLKFQNSTETEILLTTFRIVTENSLTVYKIDRLDYKGLPIYQQTGDMSAGFAVTHSLMTLKNGMAGTYEHTQYGGPHPVYATPDFLQKSIKATVDLYNAECGANTKIKTVVIGTGSTPVNYLISSTGAAFLPIHFLVAANSTKEINDILDTSSAAGNPAFATYGYDASMPGVGVAWIKMLSLPAEYRKFIRDHHVENVILFGMDEKIVGETLARKVIRLPGESEKGYQDGSVFILYTNFGSVGDLAAIKDRIYDYDELRLGKEHHICDWESGIVQEQIDRISKQVKDETDAQVYLMNSVSDVNLSMYNLASFLHMEWMKKNNLKPAGFILNEYLTSYPEYELYNGWIPLIYWQFNPPASTVERLDILKTAVSKLFPDIPMTNFYADKKAYLNSGRKRYELSDEMQKLGFKKDNIRIRQASDHWNPSNDADNQISAVEEFSYDIIGNIGLDTYNQHLDGYSPLSVDDLMKVKDFMNASGLDMRLELL